MGTETLELNRTLVVSEVAQILRQSKRTIRRWASTGVLPRPIRLGRRLVWRREVIEQLLNTEGAAHA